MKLATNIIGRAAQVEENNQTVRDATAGKQVTIIAATSDQNGRVFFTVLFQEHPQMIKQIFAYPAIWLYFQPWDNG